MSPRVVIHDPCPQKENPAATALQGQGFELVQCLGGQELLEEVIQNRPDALVYALCPDMEQDLGILGLIRRASPDLPLVLLAPDDSISTRRRVLALRPIYYAVWPTDAVELREAVLAAVVKSSRPRHETRPAGH
jgi:DNA-binding NarL/FixJ family response regulator